MGLLPKELKGSLSSLREFFKVDCTVEHDAYEDALSTIKVYKKMLDLIGVKTSFRVRREVLRCTLLLVNHLDRETLTCTWRTKMKHTLQEMEMLSRLAKGAYKTHNELGLYDKMYALRIFRQRNW